MKENENLDNLVDEIQSLPEPDYMKDFDLKKQKQIHENLMNFSRSYESKKRIRHRFSRITAGVASLAAVILLCVIFIPWNEDLNNATVPPLRTFEQFFHQKMVEMHKDVENYTYTLVHSELSVVHKDDAIAIFTEINNHSSGEQIYIAYFEKHHKKWEWQQTRGAQWNSRMKWSSMNQKPYIYSGPLSDNSIKEVFAGEEKAKIIRVGGDKRFWYAISPIKEVQVKVVTDQGDEINLEQVVTETDEPSSPEVKTFELSDIEKEAYHLFQTDLDLKHLDGLEPISIAKLYVQAGFDKKYDVEYALYTDREGYVQWSKEDHEEIPEAHRASEEHYINLFNTIDKGTFILTSEHTGYIKNDLNGFSMVKNEDGIWQVSFMPIQ
ncbi:hypothetical protein [Bacillus sp. PS06]|uniref:hypothetical protein n=1 Tax=Bacillus sp. PS06 TaxID=2764176 RepID=UPI001CD83BB5|nr:hypothetical protein [Bacillus sp. PS06]